MRRLHSRAFLHAKLSLASIVAIGWPGSAQTPGERRSAERTARAGEDTDGASPRGTVSQVVRRPLIPLACLAASALVLSACGSSSSGSAPPPSIAVSFSMALPGTVVLGGNFPIAATVSNDSSHAGVIWTCTPLSACGTFTPTQTASGVSTTYTAPPSVPSAGFVTIIAASAADIAATASGKVTIIPGISVSFSPALPSSINVSGSFMIAANVSNDSSNAGVNWACTPSGACGGFTATHTASGVPTSYMAPLMVPPGGSATITATSAADSTKFASGNVTITAGGAISVSFGPAAPPPALTINTPAEISATITSTVANAVNEGVDWSASCSGATSGCGTFSANHTNSGISTTYTAPPSAPAGGLAVTVEATSTFDPTASASAVIAVSTAAPSTFLCAGCSYTFTVSGREESSPYAVAGQFTADGMGNVTGGEQDFRNLATSTMNAPDTIISGNYSFTADGRGTLVLTTADRGTETLGVALVSASHMLITEFDTMATGSGTMDLQTLSSFSTSTLSGGYAFVSSGTSFSTTHAGEVRAGFGGVFTVTSPGAISGKGSTCDDNYGGNVSTQQGLTGSFPTPDGFGRVQVTLNPDFIGAQGLKGPIVLAAYINDAMHLKFVEVDPNFGVTSGMAVGQGASTGTFTSASVLPANSSYVFAALGVNTSSLFLPVSFATTYTSDGAGDLLFGTSDVNDFGEPSGGAVTGTYSVDTTGTGRVAVALTGNTLTRSDKIANNFAIYLTGDSDPALVLELDDFGITTGFAYTQAAGPFSLTSFSGPYGLNFTLFDPTGQFEYDATGQLLADGQGNLLGTLDLNEEFHPDPGESTTGSYASSASGRFTGSVSFSTMQAGPLTLQLSYYVVSPTEVVIIETDATAVTLGVLQLQTLPF